MADLSLKNYLIEIRFYPLENAGARPHNLHSIKLSNNRFILKYFFHS